jgi:protein-S-isoprenylcysteine O-methyltransferase Ste14
MSEQYERYCARVKRWHGMPLLSWPEILMFAAMGFLAVSAVFWVIVLVFILAMRT